MTLRLSSNLLARAVMYLFTALALVPLGLVLVFTIANGWHVAVTPEFYFNFERPVGIPGAGVNHAIVGTLMLVGMASVIAIPAGVISGVYLAEYQRSAWARQVRLATDVLTGAPSIAIGLVAYAVLVAPLKHFSAFSGSVALSILMLPVVIRTTESALVLVPNGIREAGLALGLPRWRVALQLVVPAGLPGVVTGCMLAIARASGETAPLLFTAFGNRIFNGNPAAPTAALPLIVYHDALTPFRQLQDQAWGAALVLVALVLFINLAGRWVLRRQIALAARLS